MRRPLFDTTWTASRSHDDPALHFLRRSPILAGQLPRLHGNRTEMRRSGVLHHVYIEPEVEGNLG
jgi:hypothetical protein